MRGLGSPFTLGLRDAAPFTIPVVPFAMLFGLVASEAGWTVNQATAMSILVIAGAAQFTAVQLLAEGAPVLIAIATALAVNLRLAMYSASLAVHLGALPLGQRAALAYLLTDQSYGCAVNRFTLGPAYGPRERVAYFFGASLPLAPLWYGFTWVGAVAGAAVPEALALDFAIPLMFLAMIGPMLRDRLHVVVAALAFAVSLLFAGLPYSLGILVAGGLAMAAGALLEGPGEAAR